MLVLTRKINETIFIAENIRVTIMDINGRKVRLASRRRRTSRSYGRSSSGGAGRPRGCPPGPEGDSRCPSGWSCQRGGAFPDRRDLKLSAERRA